MELKSRKNTQLALVVKILKKHPPPKKKKTNLRFVQVHVSSCIRRPEIFKG